MFEKWYFDPNSIKNVTEGDRAIGFSLEFKPTYYRGVYVSLIEKIHIEIDGKVMDENGIIFSVEDGTFTWKELGCERTARWKFGEKAHVFVPFAGGIPAGHHTIRLIVGLRISYWGGFQHTDRTFEFDIV